jgi:hypothetical protein
MAIERENDEFLVTPLKLIQCLTGLVNRTGTPKLRQISHQNGHKNENEEFLVTFLKHLPGLTGLVNYPVTQKMWTIAQENSHKTTSFL